MFPVADLRRQFPALHVERDVGVPIYLDGPAGTQIPQRVLDAMVHYFTHCNANHGGVFATSVESDRIIAAAHSAMADLLNAPSPEEIIFGQNMTSLTLHLSRSLARMLRPDDEVMVTRLDHDANVWPWVLAARDAGATMRWIDIRPEDASLDIVSFRRQLSKRTKLVAVGMASNGLGTINPVAAITREAKAAGASVFLDAVHFAPHGPIDVQELDCDFVACSAYKFFGPHVGVLWGRRELLEAMPAYKIRPAPDTLPGKWMTGTQNHEGLAGVAAAVEYLADVGAQIHQPAAPAVSVAGALKPRRAQLLAAMTAIQNYERTLSERLLVGLAVRPRFTVWGVRDVNQLHRRVPTVAITDAHASPQQLAEFLAARHIYVWNGNMYALEVSERLGLEARGGFVRLGLVHYNTVDEVDKLLKALDELP
jgi:cysteine desulfurase family protein (TIGR01976 family)